MNGGDAHDGRDAGAETHDPTGTSVAERGKWISVLVGVRPGKRT
jgi:hypothetical protein